MIYFIALLALILRLINLNQSLWLDEAITAEAIKNNSILGLIIKFSLGDFHPPLYYLLLKIWSNIFGYSETALRFPSVIFGVITVFVIFKIGEKLISRRAGILGALFLAVNPLAVYYSQEARMYSLAMLLISLSVWFMIQKKKEFFVIFLALALYTDYVPYLMLPVFFFFSSMTFIACALLIPWTPFIISQLAGGIGVSQSWGDLLGRTSLKNLLLVPVKFIFGRISLENKIFYVSIVTFVSGIYLYIISQNKNKILWLWLVTPLLLGALISLKIPIYSYFRFLFVLPAFVLLLASGTKSWKSIIFVILVSLLSLIYFNLNSSFQREDWRSAIAYMNNQPGLAIMPNVAQDAPLKYYSLNQNIIDNNNLAVNGYQTVYLFRYVQEIFDPNETARTFLEAKGFQKTEERNFNGVVIWKYML